MAAVPARLRIRDKHQRLQRRHVREVICKGMQRCSAVVRVRVENFARAGAVEAPAGGGSSTRPPPDIEPWAPSNFNVEHAADEALEMHVVL